MLHEEDLNYLKKFGQNIKRIRVLKELTQQHLADLLEVEISQISRIERGVINTSIINAKKIAEALEVGIVDLFKTE